MARLIKNFQLPEDTVLPLRPMIQADVPAICKRLNAYLDSFEFSPIFSVPELQHWFMPLDGVVYSYVTEDADGEVDAFVSFYCLPSTILHRPHGHEELNAMYLFYYIPPSQGGDAALRTLINDALILGKKVCVIE